MLNVVKETREYHKMKTVPRVAGGWVRDKLLERFSHDLDIALDDCLGEEFANKANEYLESKGEATKTVGVIRANPSQSKHLATATVKIHNREVDFVNLRSETYEGDSRIPKIDIGTPVQDAERRDFTVNSMFFNVITGQVEDFTGKGLEDLANGVLRTPLPASITFRDDPLRMLRGIRFAARYGFRLDEELCQALADPHNAAALETKVSNERIGIELDKSLKGERPKLALKLIVSHGLGDAVFKVPPERFTGDRMEQPSRVDWLTGLRIVEALTARLGDKADKHPEPVVIYLSAILFPLGLSEFVVKKGKRESVVRHVVSNSLRLGNVVSERVHQTVVAAVHLTSFMMREETDDERMLLGRLVFDVKDAWMDGLLLSLAVLEAGRAYSKDEHKYVIRAIQRADQLSQRIRRDWALDRIWEKLQKDPILDGKALMTILNIKGAEVGKAVSHVRDFVFINKFPESGPERDEFVVRATEYVKSHWR